MTETSIVKSIQLAVGAAPCLKCKKEKTGTHNSYCRDCYNAYKRNRYLVNRKKEIARCLKWNKENPQAVAANMRLCRERNPSHYLNYSRIYRKKYADRYKMHNHNKMVKRKLAGYAPLLKADWESIKKIHGNICFYCEKYFEKLTMDHLIPLSKGGPHALKNIVPACKSCNSRKHALMPRVFMERFGNAHKLEALNV